MNAFLLQLEQLHLDQSNRVFYPSLELWELSSPGLQGQGELVSHSCWDIPPSVFAWTRGVRASLGQNAMGLWQGRDGQGHLSYI